MKITSSLCLVIFSIFLVKSSLAVSLEEYLTLTSKEKLKLDKFREKVSERLPHSWMKEDVYLIRWLRTRNFNLDAAERLLMENVKWREENRIDDILNEDWSHFEREYRYTIEGCDKTGRPVVSVNVGDWPVRRAVIAGQTERMMRYFDKLMEEVNVVIREAQRQGKNVTQYSHIFEMGNYNLQQQGCPLCIPIFIHLFTSYESHFPLGVHRMTLVDTPQIFQSLLAIVKPLMSPTSRDSLFVYGRDKKEWQGALLEESNPDQLTKRFGGTKESGFEMEDFRELGKLPC